MSTRAKLIWSIGGILAVVLFFGVFISGAPWRWQVERRMAEVRARGEPVCLADLKPKAVPAEEDGGPLLEAIWRDFGELAAFRDHYSQPVDFGAEKIQALIRQAAAKLTAPKLSGLKPTKKNLSTQEAVELQVRDLVDLLSQQPQILDRLDQALRRPHFHFTLDYRGRYASMLLPYLGKCRESAWFLAKLSNYYQAIGDNQSAQRCRLLLLRSPHMLDEDFTGIGSYFHCTLSNIACRRIERQLPHLSEAEILEIKQIAEAMHPWDNWHQCLVAERVTVFDSLTLRYDEVEEFGRGVENSHFYFGTYLHLKDGLGVLSELNHLIDGKPLSSPSQRSHVWKRSFDFFETELPAKLRYEAAVIRRFRIRLELELIQRRSGAYPADLRGIPLPQEDAEGKPMRYHLESDGLPQIDIGTAPLSSL